MQLGREEQERLRLLSDGALYEQAMQFVKQNDTVDNAQVNGLVSHAQDWHNLEMFVRHQASRDWQKRKRHYRDFYRALQTQLGQLRAQAKKHFVPESMGKSQSREQTAFYAELLAREFIQHLAAEILFREGGA